MFKAGYTYKIKVEISPDDIGFGRASVQAVDGQCIYFHLRSSRGHKLDVPVGAKIWFVGNSLDNRFNGLWCAEIRGVKTIDGAPTLYCRLPRFERQSQRRAQSRIEFSAPVKLIGEEWRNLNAPIKTRNISRLGLGFAIACQCHEFFQPGRCLNLSIKDEEYELEASVRVVTSRYNWLVQSTEVGAEFCKQDNQTMDSLEEFISHLTAKKAGRKSELSESGSLSRWVKAEKDKLSLIKPPAAELPATSNSDKKPNSIDESKNTDTESETKA